MKKITKHKQEIFLVFLMVLILILIFSKNFHSASYLLILYGITVFQIEIRSLKHSVDIVWWFIKERNDKADEK